MSERTKRRLLSRDSSKKRNLLLVSAHVTGGCVDASRSRRTQRDTAEVAGRTRTEDRNLYLHNRDFV